MGRVLGSSAGLVTRRAPLGAPTRRAIPSTREEIPIVGLGTWITFNVGRDEVAEWSNYVRGMAVALQGVRPPEDRWLKLTPASREVWSEPALAQEVATLLDGEHLVAVGASVALPA
mgnify:CR=1 FL=1